MVFFTYMLRCNDGSFYVGHTEDLENRMEQHQSGALGGYTASRLPVSLEWSQVFPTRDEAFDAERQIKGWSRAKKQALIAGDWERISMLPRNRQR
jgi:predicted GIY-YIG superfamily endonuclease